MTATQLAEATPSSRERYVDFLRAVSIVVVVLGHWLMAVVVIDGGGIAVGNVIARVPGLWALTWVLQVMPVFFFVGGFANAVGYASVERRGGGWAEFAVGRVRRVMRPVGVLLAVWIPVILVLQEFVAPKTLRAATTLVSQPLWFIGIYLIVCAFAPPMLRWYRRAGWWSIAALAAAAALVDFVRFTADVDAVGYLNFAFVWLFAQQIGFAYADGSLARLHPKTFVRAAFAAVLVLAALVFVGPYPASMVGLPGERISNMAPPTVCLAVCTVWQIALVMLLRERANRWLQHRGPWTATIAINGRIMTIFCWHLTAALGAVGVAYAVGVPFPHGATTEWWITRPAWLAGCGALLAALVWAFGRFERPARPAAADVPFALALPGVLLAIVGLCGIAAGGLSPFFATRSPVLGFIGLSPVTSVAELLIGLALLAPHVPARVARRF